MAPRHTIVHTYIHINLIFSNEKQIRWKNKPSFREVFHFPKTEGTAVISKLSQTLWFTQLCCSLVLVSALNLMFEKKSYLWLHRWIVLSFMFFSVCNLVCWLWKNSTFFHDGKEACLFPLDSDNFHFCKAIMLFPVSLCKY